MDFNVFEECPYPTSCLIIVCPLNIPAKDLNQTVEILKLNYNTQEVSVLTFLKRIVCVFNETTSAIDCKKDIDSKNTMRAFYINVNE